MKRNYFIIVVGHPVYGRIKRLRVPHYLLHVMLAVLLCGLIAGVGVFASYTRMLVKVSEFNQIRSEKNALQKQFEQLKQTVEERDVQLASLGSLASEVSIAFGIRRQHDAAVEVSEGLPGGNFFQTSLHQFDFLQQVRLTPHEDNSMWYWLSNTTPSIWPVQGRLSSSFGNRTDPFLGIGAFHPGIDMTAPKGTPVVAAADGTVVSSGWSGGYGKRLVLSHGRNGLTTVYAHLSEMYVRPGQVVRRGEVIGRVGRTGRVTSSHLHYEVRYQGTPLNPYKYLKKASSRSGNAFSVAD